MDKVYFGRDQKVQESTCPYCHHQLDGVTATSLEHEDPVAEVGDFSVCMYCGSVLRFEVGMKLKLADDSDLKELLKEQPEHFALLNKIARAALQRVRQRRRGNYRSN